MINKSLKDYHIPVRHKKAISDHKYYATTDNSLKDFLRVIQGNHLHHVTFSSRPRNISCFNIEYFFRLPPTTWCHSSFLISSQSHSSYLSHPSSLPPSLPLLWISVPVSLLPRQAVPILAPLLPQNPRSLQKTG